MSIRRGTGGPQVSKQSVISGSLHSSAIRIAGNGFYLEHPNATTEEWSRPPTRSTYGSAPISSTSGVGMTSHLLQPEVFGALGPGTVMGRSTHPLVLSELEIPAMQDKAAGAEVNESCGDQRVLGQDAFWVDLN